MPLFCLNDGRLKKIAENIFFVALDVFPYSNLKINPLERDRVISSERQVPGFLAAFLKPSVV